MKKILNEWKRFLNESGFPRIMKILSGGVPSVDTVAFMTAANPMGEPLPSKQNIERNRDLAQWLREKGLGFIRIRGRFGGPEKSFIVNNIMKDEAIAAGKRFEQEAVIWGEKTFNDDGEPTGFRFYYIEGDDVVQARDVVLAGSDVQSKDDYYSQERQSAGRKFIIPFFDADYEVENTSENKRYLSFLSLTDSQRDAQKDIIKEINRRSKLTLQEKRTAKSRWHHRKIIQLKLQELHKNL